ncbi:unnamed protein product, partial [Polarella glacialis]
HSHNTTTITLSLPDPSTFLRGMGKRGCRPRAQKNAGRGRGPKGLRQSYLGFCPLSEGQGGDSQISGGGGEVERRDLSSLGPAAFFDDFVRRRKPVILDARSAKGGPLAELLGLRGATW